MLNQIRDALVALVALVAMANAMNILPAMHALADPAPQESTLRFEVMLDGRPIGGHALTFDPQPDGSLKVAIDIDLDIRFGPFTVFAYNHRNRTLWRAGKLLSLQSETNDNGTEYRIRATAGSQGLQIHANDEAPFTISASTLPSTYWMATTIQQNQLINTQTGELLEISVRKVGREQVTGPSGLFEATHFRMEGDLEIDLWYDDTGVLVGLAFETRGSQVTYRLVERQGNVPASSADTVLNMRN